MITASLEEMIQHGKKYGFDQVISNYELDDDKIDGLAHYLNDVNWCGLPIYQKLSEKIITKYKQKFCWLFVRQMQKHIDATTINMIELERFIDSDDSDEIDYNE